MINENSEKIKIKLLSENPDKSSRQTLIFAFLKSLELKPFSNNENSHIQVRNVNFKIDIWPGTCRSKIAWNGEIYNSLSLETFCSNVEKLAQYVKVKENIEIGV